MKELDRLVGEGAEDPTKRGEKMVVEEREGLSKSWRTTGSSIKAVDLANAIKTLQNLSDSGLAQNKREPLPVSWGLQSMSTQQEIKLNIGLLKDVANPIPSRTFDAIVGQGRHEDSHVVNPYGVISPDPILGAVERLGEEVFVDRASEYHFGPVAREYIRRARDYELDGSVQKPVTSAFEAWKKEAVYGYTPGSYPSALSPTDELCLQVLTHLTGVLLTTPLDQLQATQRRTLYLKVAETIAKLLEQAEEVRDRIVDTATDPSKDDTGTPDDGGCTLGPGTDSGDGSGDGSGARVEPTRKKRSRKPSKAAQKAVQEETEKLQQAIGESSLDLNQKEAEALEAAKEPHSPTAMSKIDQLDLEALVAEVAKHIESGTVDLEENVAELLQEVGFNDRRRSPILYKNPVRGDIADDSWDKPLYSKLQWIRNLKNLVSHQTLRAESYGSLDATRLYRGAIDGLAFKQRRKIDVTKTDITCLLDASSSMRGREAIYGCANTMHRVLPETQILSYDSNGSHCEIALHTKGRGLPTKVCPRGGTPSGRALLGTAIKHPKGLIVHFTDGESNSDLTVEDACRTLATTHPKLKVLDICLGRGSAVSFGPNHNRVYIKGVEDFAKVMLEGVKKFYQV